MAKDTIEVLKGAEQVYYELMVQASTDAATMFAILQIVQTMVQLNLHKAELPDEAKNA